MQMLLQQGLFAGQQAMQLEGMGNAQGAAQCYDQAAQTLGAAIGQAQTVGMPIGDQVFNWEAQAQFGAARTKASMGLLPLAAMHLQQALNAANQAVMRNPGFGPNHALAGMILCALGNVPEAVRALSQACMLNPADQVSRAMLGQLGAVMPAVPLGGPVPMAGMMAAPLPIGPLPQVAATQFVGVASAPQEPEAGDGGHDRMKTIGTFLDLTTKVLSAMQQAEQTFGFKP